MKYRIKLLQPLREVNHFGEEATTYQHTKTIHAERVKLTGARSEEAKEHFADYRTDFNIRDAHEVSEGWRVEQVGGHLYEVTNILPNIDRGFKTLICTRINE